MPRSTHLRRYIGAPPFGKPTLLPNGCRAARCPPPQIAFNPLDKPLVSVCTPWAGCAAYARSQEPHFHHGSARSAHENQSAKSPSPHAHPRGPKRAPNTVPQFQTSTAGGGYIANRAILPQTNPAPTSSLATAQRPINTRPKINSTTTAIMTTRPRVNPLPPPAENSRSR